MAIVFIIGVNKGLGNEPMKRLITMGHKVYIGYRNEKRGKVAAKELGSEAVRIDVTLINNAGVSSVFKRPEDITSSDVERVYKTDFLCCPHALIDRYPPSNPA